MISSSAINRLVDLKVQNSQFRNNLDAESQNFDIGQRRAMSPYQLEEARMRNSAFEQNQYAAVQDRNLDVAERQRQEMRNAISFGRQNREADDQAGFARQNQMEKMALAPLQRSEAVMRLSNMGSENIYNQRKRAFDASRAGY